MPPQKKQLLVRRLALYIAAVFSSLGLNGCKTGCTARQSNASGPHQHLRVGEAITSVVCARRRYNDTLLFVRAGETYRFVIHSPNSWKDWYHSTCAGGYPSMFLQKPWESGRVIPTANWFALCGEITLGERFVIGNGPSQHPFQSSGSLFLFANDHPWSYWNNFGQISVSIVRMK